MSAMLEGARDWSTLILVHRGVVDWKKTTTISRTTFRENGVSRQSWGLVDGILQTP